jgi:hypothetical protein
MLHVDALADVVTRTSNPEELSAANANAQDRANVVRGIDSRALLTIASGSGHKHHVLLDGEPKPVAGPIKSKIGSP